MLPLFVEAFKRGADPREVERVCKAWYNLMRYTIPSNEAPKKDQADIPYFTKLNDIFMEDCMRLYLENIVSGIALNYKKGQPGKEQLIRFLDFQDGTARLSACEGAGCDQVYTLSEDRFLEVEGANQKKIVTFFAP